MRIISDTTCHLSIQEADALGVRLVANQVIIGETTYKDYLDIDSDKFIELIKTRHPQTSQPSAGDIMIAYEEKNTETLHITTGRGLSSAFDTACGVVKSMDIDYVTVFDSQSVAGVNRYLTQLAARLKDKVDLNTLINRLNACLKETQSYVMPVNFEFLKRSGRLTPAAAILGSFLNLKPIMAQSSDRQRIERFGVGRTWHAAIKAVVDDLVKRGVNAKHRIYVAHAFNMESVNMAIEQIKEKIHDADIETLLLAPAMITHGGPGSLVIQYILRDDQ
ncbi:MAG: DegV family protein [Erysipelothrix sp.]|nr:DegV family protein [Erysipelothrix sp.]